MKYFLWILFILVFTGLGIGLYIQPDNPPVGDKFIGLSIMALFFVLMPIFIWYRWRGKNIQDYMLTKENIMKMRERERQAEEEKRKRKREKN